MKRNLLSIITVMLLFQLGGCQSNGSYEYPFQNPGLSPAKRAANVVSLLTLEEKVAQMLNSAPGIDRLGIPPYDWWNEALHGVARTEYPVTSFPQAIGMAATWDAEAMRKMGDITSTEGRAVYNLASARKDYRIYRGLTYWSPNINIFRDPRWGRGQETYGEDPFLTGIIGKNFVLGLQGDDRHYLKTAACAKHYAVHSGPESKRHVFNASVSNYDLWDTYLPAFKTLITESDVAGVMCAYNAWQGQPCCGSDQLMIDILRKEWKFTGYVTSDCGGIADFFHNHKTHPDAPHAAADAVLHGTDVECGQSAYKSLVKAVQDGLISESQIDVSLQRLFEIRFRLGMFDPKEKVPYGSIDTTAFSNDAHKAHALKMAQEAIVLLKNDGTLPLKKENLKKVALLGPNVNRPEVQLGNYNGNPKKLYTPLEGIRTRLGEVELITELGCDYTTNESLVDLDLTACTNGFSVEFFNNMNLEGAPAYRGTVKKIDIRLASGNKPAENVNPINFSSRFEGTFTAPQTGTIEFVISHDDGYRLYVDGKLLSDRWKVRADTRTECRIDVEKGRKYRLKLEHVQAEGGSVIKLAARSVIAASVQDVADRVKDADAIIFIGGITPRLEGEEMPVHIPGFAGGDRTSILLPQVQTDLLKALKATGKPVVFVMMTGSAIATPWESENINAIVNAWYGGELAGNAIADVLFGDYNPSGRLPVTFYRSDEDLPDFDDYNMDNRTYKYFTGTPLYPFGFGLSYTTFEYEWNRKPKATLSASGVINCAFNVKNTGKTAGDVVGQVYVSYPEGKKLPLKELRHFERLSLAPGETSIMNISIPAETLAKWDETAGKLTVPHGIYTIYAGNHSDDKAAFAQFEIK
jgi:beta-glucosidase